MKRRILAILFVGAAFACMRAEAGEVAWRAGTAKARHHAQGTDVDGRLRGQDAAGGRNTA